MRLDPGVGRQVGIQHRVHVLEGFNLRLSIVRAGKLRLSVTLSSPC